MKGGVAFLLLRLLAGCLIAVWTGRCAAGLVRHSLTDNWNGGGGARAPQSPGGCCRLSLVLDCTECVCYATEWMHSGYRAMRCNEMNN